MIQAFYQSEPDQDTPYRELSLHHDGNGWWVRHSAGEKRGPASTVLSEISVKNFDEGRELFNNLYNELAQAGWKPYNPQ